MNDRFEKESFEFNGNYRAIVENNEDPKDAGRVQVRIIGIHSVDTNLTPVSHLPWAEPCLGIAHSGGHNMANAPDKGTTRYSPDGSSYTPTPRDTTTFKETDVDTVLKNSGTGGEFTVPRKGTMVWVFFEQGNHNRVHYWAAAPKSIDWDEQKKKIQTNYLIVHF